MDLKKEYHIPWHLIPWHLWSWRSAFLILPLILLPNIGFLCGGYFLGLARPLINLDYLLVIVALIIIPWRSVRTIPMLAFVLLAMIDVVMMAMQLFPFMDFHATIYLAKFLPQAPTRYLVLVAVVIVYILVMPFILATLTRRLQLSKVTTVIVCLLVLLVGYIARNQMYKQVPAEHFARNNYFWVNSQANLYKEHYGAKFISLMQDAPTLVEGQEDYASKLFKKPYAKKILLVVLESWGAAERPVLQRAMLQKFDEQKDNFEFFEEGRFDFSGATVGGELRELCQLKIEKGFALSKTPKEQFANCLPNQLKKLGYRTFGVHPATKLMYDRYSWYKKAGMDNVLFSEGLKGYKRCHPFNGICDNEIYPKVAETFAKYQQDKIFYYWLTLTSHAPYVAEDLNNPRLDCKKLELPKGDICNNLRHITQFLDGLAELVKRPEMKGVEVIAVGDHMPPLMTDEPYYYNIRWNDVSWIHFKVKE